MEDLLRERGIEVSHETVRFWWQRFGPYSQHAGVVIVADGTPEAAS